MLRCLFLCVCATFYSWDGFRVLFLRPKDHDTYIVSIELGSITRELICSHLDISPWSWPIVTNVRSGLLFFSFSFFFFLVFFNSIHWTYRLNLCVIKTIQIWTTTALIHTHNSVLFEPIYCVTLKIMFWKVIVTLIHWIWYRDVHFMSNERTFFESVVLKTPRYSLFFFSKFSWNNFRNIEAKQETNRIFIAHVALQTIYRLTECDDDRRCVFNKKRGIQTKNNNKRKILMTESQTSYRTIHYKICAF